MSKSKAMVDYQKSRSESKKAKVEATLDSLKKKKKIISKTEFCKMAGCSLQFLYKYPELNNEVDKFCNPSSKKINKNMESKDTIIMTLRAKIKMLEQENSALKKDSQYKERCEILEEKVKHLEEQLKNSYASNLDDDF